METHAAGVVAYTAGYRAGYLAACHHGEPPPGLAAAGAGSTSGAGSRSAAVLAPLFATFAGAAQEISQVLAEAGGAPPGPRDPPRPPLQALLQVGPRHVTQL